MRNFTKMSVRCSPKSFEALVQGDVRGGGDGSGAGVRPPEVVHLDLTPKEFYKVLHEMERAKNNLEALVGSSSSSSATTTN